MNGEAHEVRAPRLPAILPFRVVFKVNTFRNLKIFTSEKTAGTLQLLRPLHFHLHFGLCCLLPDVTLVRFKIWKSSGLVQKTRIVDRCKVKWQKHVVITIVLTIYSPQSDKSANTSSGFFRHTVWLCRSQAWIADVRMCHGLSLRYNNYHINVGLHSAQHVMVNPRAIWLEVSVALPLALRGGINIDM